MNTMAHQQRALWGLLSAPVLVLAAFFAIPMAVVAVASFGDAAGRFTLAQYAKILLDQYHWEVLATTLRIAALTTVWCLLLGFPLAYYLVRLVRWRLWRRVCVILLITPLFTSNVVRSFGWMVLLGRNGMVNDGLLAAGLVERPVRWLGTEAGILIGMVYVLLPFVVLAVGNALAAVDDRLEQASADLGAGPYATFMHITLPLCMPGVIGGAVMVFTLAISAYVTPALLSGGRVTVFSMLIFQQYSSVFDFHYGGALSMTLLVITLLLVALAGRLAPRETAP
jgi:putative spermidine/putrescine transport system permease protein